MHRSLSLRRCRGLVACMASCRMQHFRARADILQQQHTGPPRQSPRQVLQQQSMRSSCVWSLTPLSVTASGTAVRMCSLSGPETKHMHQQALAPL